MDHLDKLSGYTFSQVLTNELEGYIKTSKLKDIYSRINSKTNEAILKILEVYDSQEIEAIKNNGIELTDDTKKLIKYTSSSFHKKFISKINLDIPQIKRTFNDFINLPSLLAIATGIIMIIILYIMRINYYSIVVLAIISIYIILLIFIINISSIYAVKKRFKLFLDKTIDKDFICEFNHYTIIFKEYLNTILRYSPFITKIRSDLKDYTYEKNDILNFFIKKINEKIVKKINVCIVGAKNTGKSTFINAIINRKLLPVSNYSSDIIYINNIQNGHVSEEYVEIFYEDEKITLNINELPNLTLDENKIQKINIFIKLNFENVSFIDTPPLSLSEDKIQKIAEDSDIIIYLLDCRQCPRKEDFNIFRKYKNHLQKFIFIVNKVEQFEDDEIEDSISGLYQMLKDKIWFEIDDKTIESLKKKFTEEKLDILKTIQHTMFTEEEDFLSVLKSDFNSEEISIIIEQARNKFNYEKPSIKPLSCGTYLESVTEKGKIYKKLVSFPESLNYFLDNSLKFKENFRELLKNNISNIIFRTIWSCFLDDFLPDLKLKCFKTFAEKSKIIGKSKKEYMDYLNELKKEKGNLGEKIVANIISNCDPVLENILKELLDNYENKEKEKIKKILYKSKKDLEEKQDEVKEILFKGIQNIENNFINLYNNDIFQLLKQYSKNIMDVYNLEEFSPHIDFNNKDFSLVEICVKPDDFPPNLRQICEWKKVKCSINFLFFKIYFFGNLNLMNKELQEKLINIIDKIRNELDIFSIKQSSKIKHAIEMNLMEINRECVKQFSLYIDSEIKKVEEEIVKEKTKIIYNEEYFERNIKNIQNNISSFLYEQYMLN